MRFFVASAAITLAAVTFSPNASANGRLPGANQLVVGPHNELALRMTFGVLVPDDAGKWRWMCESAIGYGGIQDPAIGIMSDKSIIAGLFTGLSHSAIDRCAWQFSSDGPKGQVVMDVTVRKDDPSAALALASTYDGGGGANHEYKVQIYETTDNAKTWAALGTTLPRDTFVETLEVAATRPSRIYVSATYVQSPLRAVVYITDDRGATWTKSEIQLLAPSTSEVEKALYVAAIDPKTPDRVYARTGGEGPSRLLVSDDGGKTWVERIKLTGQMLGFALSPDGSRVYVEGRQDGVKVASTSDWQFTRTSTIEVECLTATASELYACSNEASGFILGSSTDEGKTFKPLLHFTDIAGPLECSTDAGALCASEWPALRDKLGSSTSPDAGSLSDAGDSGIGGEPTQPVDGCSCKMTNSGRSASAIALALVAFAGIARRRQRASR